MTANRAYTAIWAAVKKIPRGKVATYGQIATLAGYAKQPRLAGYALAHTPASEKIAWHRVINAQGKIALPPRSAGYRQQRTLLENEGVTFIAGRVDLKRYRWQPCNDSPLLD